MLCRERSESRSVSPGQLPGYSYEPSQHDETSVPGYPGRLGENHGGVERPMEPVSCRTPEWIPAFSGGVVDKYGKTITNEFNGLLFQ